MAVSTPFGNARKMGGGIPQPQRTGVNHQKLEGWGDGSVGIVLARQVYGPLFNSPELL